MQTNLKYLLVFFILLLTLSVNAQQTTNKFIVVLDAGHGGKDPGRPTKYDKEKNVALKVVLEIGKELEKDKSIKVIYTRKTDVFLELHERAAIANKADADLFVSIHCNAHGSQAYGTETFVLSVENTDRNFEVAKAENEVIYLEDDYEKNYAGYDPSSPKSLIGLTLQQEDFVEQSIYLARMVENNFKNKLKRKSRGVKQQSLWVMHNTYMPSVLIETGFLTNRVEGKYLSSKKGQREISKSIVDAILEYKNNLMGDIDVVVENDEPANSDADPSIVYKVQIAAGARKLETKSYNFKGLKNISREKIGNGFKYFYGETSDYAKVKSLKDEAYKKGYTSCFIVAYKNGEQIKISDL